MISTQENRGHSHTISDPSSGMTDYSLDSRGRKHRHHLSSGCTACDRLRKNTIHYGNWGTSFAFGHSHFYDPRETK